MIFGRKSNDEQAPDDSNPSAFVPQPEKARAWFQHGRTALDTYNYEYALWCYANGTKFDPEEMSAHEAMYEAAIKLHGKGAKAAPGKELRKLDGPNPVDKFVAAEYAWMRSLTNSSLALRLLDAAAKAEQFEFGRWLAPKLLGMLRQQKKPSKSDFVKAMTLLGQVNAWEQAISAGEIAVQIDPTDAELQQQLKNLAAQRAMDQGGYEKAAGQEGGFRSFVKNMDKQRELEEAESIAGGSSIDERNLQRAKAAYEENPEIPDNIHKYGQLVKKQGTPEAEELAHTIYIKGYESTKEYRFRMAAGDIRISQLERSVKELQSKADAAPEDESLREELASALEALLTLQASEYAERESKYPTDRRMKYLRGEVEYRRGNVDDAMPCFQNAKDDPKLRVNAGYYLGLCFAKEGWHNEAISEFKEALDRIDPTEKEKELSIRYDLMVSLLEHAKLEKSIDHAKEALDICSGIARKDITYRDIRVRRKELDSLIRELSGSETP